MFALQTLVDGLSLKEPVRAGTTYERVLHMTVAIEDALLAIQDDEEHGLSLLQATVAPLVAEVQRIEGFLANVNPDPMPAVLREATLMREGLEAYYAGVLELAQCLEDVDAAHLLEARRCFRAGHLALQAAKELIEDTWEYEAA